MKRAALRIGSVVTAGALLGWAALNAQTPPRTADRSATATRPATERTPIERTPVETRTADGKIRLAHCRIKLSDERTLASERTGVLESVMVREGSTVKPDQAVALLRDGVVRAQLAVMEKQATNDIEVRFSKKASELANTEYGKSLQAEKTVKGAVPESERQRLRLAAEKAILQIEQAEIQLAVAELKRLETLEILRTHRVVAPVDGVVTKVLKRPGEAVREGEPIVEMVNTSVVRVEGAVSVETATRIKPGCRVELIATGGEKLQFNGHIDNVSVKVESVSQTVKIWAEVVNRDNFLKDGLAATLIIVPDEVDTAYVRQLQEQVN